MIEKLKALRTSPITLLVGLAVLVGVVSGAFAQTIETSVPHAILIDADTGSVLFEKDADAPATPASTVKIMTAEVVFHELTEGRIKLDDQFLITENAWRTGGAPARASSMFAALNSRVRVEDLIRGLVIDSGNDAAIALAEGRRRLRGRLRHADDEAGPRTWPDALGLHQFLGQGRSGTESHPARDDASRRRI